ncbi:MAG: hypothetical protein E6R07_00520 [Nevskiaceae bacterium]|nr:MAG: hypothetical protein E6R07_00520 [Nevskiaceae bacterium]
MTSEEFLTELEQFVIRRAATVHLVDTMAFVAEVAERLEEDPVFGEYVQVEYSGAGSRNRQIRVHGYTPLDDSDGSIGLVIGRWSDSGKPETLSTAAVEQMTSWLQNFVDEAITGSLTDRIAEASPAYDLACNLREAGGKISRIRLHIFSNMTLSTRFKEDIAGQAGGVPLERHIWDLQRLKSLYESSKERESVSIDLSQFGSEGIPCIPAATTDSLRSFLCVIDGELLANLFERYGSRLLEGNVRSFLGMKGGVNKGIRSTIQDHPSLFFAYNNGIAATAVGVTITSTSQGHLITALQDLQIVNGGQTTSAILNARKKDRLPLAGVTVQMKLTEVDREVGHDLTPKIAQFANTQNKVAVADFFANHQFHRKMEEISRRLQVPARAGQRVQSKWFYERARGQYQNERLYLTAAKKDAHDLEFPASQVINKTELAKFDSVWRELPHWVALGAQKNFVKFAGQFASKSEGVTEAEYWAEISPRFGETYYQEIVAVSLLWTSAEEIVSGARGSWYEGDYRPQIVAYALALLLRALRGAGMELDLARIWLRQDIEADLRSAIEQFAIISQQHILHPPAGTSNVGEWCKKEECWKSLQRVDLPDLDRLMPFAIDKSAAIAARNDGRKKGELDDGIAVQKAAFDLCRSGYWQRLSDWPTLSATVPPSDVALLSKARSIASFARLTQDREWRRLMELKAACEGEGFRHKN